MVEKDKSIIGIEILNKFDKTYKTTFVYQVTVWFMNVQLQKRQIRDFSVSSITKPSLRLHIDYKTINGDTHSQKAITWEEKNKINHHYKSNCAISTILWV